MIMADVGSDTVAVAEEEEESTEGKSTATGAPVSEMNDSFQPIPFARWRGIQSTSADSSMQSTSALRSTSTGEMSYDSVGRSIVETLMRAVNADTEQEDQSGSLNCSIHSQGIMETLMNMSGYLNVGQIESYDSRIYHRS